MQETLHLCEVRKSHFAPAMGNPIPVPTLRCEGSRVRGSLAPAARNPDPWRHLQRLQRVAGCGANRSRTLPIPFRYRCARVAPPSRHHVSTASGPCTVRARVVLKWLAIAGAAARLQANLVRIGQVRSTVRMKTSTSATASRRAPITQIVFCLRKRDGVTPSARA